MVAADARVHKLGVGIGTDDKCQLFSLRNGNTAVANEIIISRNGDAIFWKHQRYVREGFCPKESTCIEIGDLADRINCRQVRIRKDFAKNSEAAILIIQVGRIIGQVKKPLIRSAIGGILLLCHRDRSP